MKPFKGHIVRSILAAFLLCSSGSAQEGIGNFTDIQLHGSGAVGFHTSFQNEGSFDSPEGLTGFYREGASLRISGSQTPRLYDVEFAADTGIWLETPIEIANNANLVQGDLRTIRTEAVAYPIFSFDSFYTGESDASKINGYASVRNKSFFVFPVGWEDRIRTLTIDSEAINAQASCAYFFESPEASGTLGQSFKSQVAESENALSISTREFWRLEATLPSRVTLTWDVLSSVSSLGQFLADLRVVGWNKRTQQWEDLGNTEVNGGRDYGSITSDTFLPDDYEILTIGGTDTVSENYETIELENYYLSPNGDGVNETLAIDAVERDPNNSIQIYNRHGQLVYTEDQYQGGFAGRSNVSMTVNRNSGLEPGIYFYIITFHDLKERHQGYFYLTD